MNYRSDFIASLGLNLSAQKLAVLQLYADLIWEKKEQLNLTSVADKQEIWDRHILDGLVAAAQINKLSQGKSVSAADYGAGAGYIGIAIKVALDFCDVTLVESLQKRCMFMDWVILKIGLKNIRVLNLRAGSGKTDLSFDFTTERAMGKIDDILPLCTEHLKQEGCFIAYQAQDSFYSPQKLLPLNLTEQGIINYNLPSDDKTRKLVIFKKDGCN